MSSVEPPDPTENSAANPVKTESASTEDGAAPAGPADSRCHTDFLKLHATAPGPEKLSMGDTPAQLTQIFWGVLRPSIISLCLENGKSRILFSAISHAFAWGLVSRIGKLGLGSIMPETTVRATMKKFGTVKFEQYLGTRRNFSPYMRKLGNGPKTLAND